MATGSPLQAGENLGDICVTKVQHPSALARWTNDVPDNSGDLLVRLVDLESASPPWVFKGAYVSSKPTSTELTGCSIFKEIGAGQRIALTKVASDHFVSHQRPLRLAIDIAIWLFQIQSGKGGSNPALRTFYYRLLRFLSLNIHPLFVFDGPNKPLFKRNKRVGGPGVRVASVPEFLAKQLLKQFGFPWHVAPGEAEAECALLQREGVVDAVMSEDVDTLMFGSGLTVRNWTPENSSKTPTHVNLYRAEDTFDASGLDREGMILVALMSGGDYIVEGIPGCGPKVACDAARAGFGRDLCAVARKKDVAALAQWRERLQHEIRTNTSKYFTRKSTKLAIPDDFPNREVLGYYTDPCVSSPDTVARLRSVLQWDQEIDFGALRLFVAEAFDWRCLGGAKKFIRNLAPAILVQRLRALRDHEAPSTEESQKQHEKLLVQAIHGKRNHATADGELEYRISFVPATLVPIDLSIEEPDDEYIPAGGLEEQAEVDDEWTAPSSITQPEANPSSPTKKRNFRPYDPSLPEKLWILRTTLVAGCPLLVESYEAPPADARAYLKARKAAKAASVARPATKTGKRGNMPPNALMAYTTITKAGVRSHMSGMGVDRVPLSELAGGSNARTSYEKAGLAGDPPKAMSASSQSLSQGDRTDNHELKCDETPKTPRRRKRPSPELRSPPGTQRTIDSYWSISSRKSADQQGDVIDLISSPERDPQMGPATPSPSEKKPETTPVAPVFFELPSTVTKRRKRAPLQRCHTVPASGNTDYESTPKARTFARECEVIDLSSDVTIAQMDLDAVQNELCLPVSLDISSSDVREGQQVQQFDQRELSIKAAGQTLQLDSEHIARRRSPRQQAKRLIRVRESLPGAWKEVEVEVLDLSGMGGEQKENRPAAHIKGWRKSGVEVLDLTGI